MTQATTHDQRMAQEPEEASSDFQRLLQKELKIGQRGVQCDSLADLMEFAQVVFQSGMAPDSLTSYKNPDKKWEWIEYPQPKAVARIAVCLQKGLEVGLPAMASLQFITVIKGRPCLWGDALPALMWASGKLAHFEERIEFDKATQNATAYCTIRRVGETHTHTAKFDVQMAIKAGLWQSNDVWKKYPQRMLQMKARSWGCRDRMADVLCGLSVAEEVMDYRGTHGTTEGPASRPEDRMEREPDPLVSSLLGKNGGDGVMAEDSSGPGGSGPHTRPQHDEQGAGGDECTASPPASAPAAVRAEIDESDIDSLYGGE